jgi:hypothetical protein
VPAPKDEFSLYIRTYWPKPEILEGKWAPPSVARVEKGRECPTGEVGRSRSSEMNARPAPVEGGADGYTWNRADDNELCAGFWLLRCSSCSHP